MNTSFRNALLAEPFTGNSRHADVFVMRARIGATNAPRLDMPRVNASRKPMPQLT